MRAFFFRKIGFFLLSLWITGTITFFLMHAVPGDPFSQEQALPKEILESLQAHYGLDRPLFIQYISYIKNLCLLRLGPSLCYSDRTVSDIIRDGFPISCALGVQALVPALLAGLSFGALGAVFRGSVLEKGINFLCLLGLCIPAFLSGVLLQYGFSVKLGWLPVARWDSFAHTVLPTVTLAALPAAFITKLFKSSLIEVFEQEYILTARSKGLSPATIVFRHAVRNALLPVIAYLGPLTASILTGGFAVEKIFGIPGLGRWFVSSVSNRDYPVIMGLTLFYSILLLFSVFVADLVSAWIDPRISLQKRRSE